MGYAMNCCCYGMRDPLKWHTKNSNQTPTSIKVLNYEELQDNELDHIPNDINSHSYDKIYHYYLREFNYQ